MFLRRLSAAVVIVTCFGWAAMGAVPDTLTTATNNGKEKSLKAPLAFPVTNDTVCHNGLSDGVFKVAYAGLLTVQSYQILNGTGTIPLSSVIPVASNNFSTTAYPLGAGTYTIKLNFTNGSSDTQTGTIFKAATALSLSAVSENPLCSGVSGKITLQGSGGYPPYTYVLRNSSNVSMPQGTPGVFSGLPAGQYFAEVTDIAGCKEYNSGTLSIVVPSPIAVPVVEVDSIDFYGDLAKITLSGLPATPSDYRITLNGNPSGAVITGTTAEISNLVAGNYTVRIEKINCPTDFWVTPTPISILGYAPVSFSWSPNSNPNNVVINCFGQDTTLSVTVNGGRAGKTVDLVLFENGIQRPLASLMPFGAPYQISNLLPNVSYILKAYTGAALPAEFPFSITGPSGMFEITNVTPTNVTCNGADDGKVLVTISGGTSPYRYSLNNSIPDISYPTLPTNRTITNLIGGSSYNLILSDAFGCISNAINFPITEPSPLSVSVLDNLTEQLTCPNSNTGKIVARGTGGTKPYYFTLEKYGQVYMPYVNIPAAGDTMVFSNLMDGDYTIKINDSEDCPAIETDVETIDLLTVNISVTFDSIQCFNGTTELNVTASGGNGSVFTYNVIDSRTGSSISPAKTELFTGQGVDFPGVPASSYRVQASYGTCPNSFKDITIPNPSQLNVFYPSSVNLACSGNDTTVIISATGSYPFQISTDGITYADFSGPGVGRTSLTGLTIGSYSYYIRDKFGCVFNNGLPITIDVTEPATIVASDLIITNETCREKNNGKVTLTVSGGTPGYSVKMGTYSQTSSDGNIVFNNIQAGTYSMVITDGNKCIAPNPPTNVVVEQPVANFVIQTPVIDPIECFGDSTSVMVDVTGGWDVSKEVWLTGYEFTSPKKPSGSSFVVKAGNYEVHALNADGCETIRNLTVDQPFQLKVKVLSNTNVTCYEANDATIRIQATGGTPGYSYDLDGSGSGTHPFTANPYTITGDIEAGSFNVIVSDENGCKSNIVPVTITEPALVEFDLRIDSVTCYGLSTGKILIQNARGGNDISYRTSLTSGTTVSPSTFPVISGLSAGNYSVRITDSKGCESELKPAPVGQPDVIVINDAIISDSLSCFGDQDAVITIDAMGGLPYNLQYKITGRSYKSDNSFSNLQAGEYEVWVRNHLGNCETRFPQKLFVVNPDQIIVTSIDKTDVSCHNLQDGSVSINASGGTGTLSYLLVGAPASIMPNPNATGRFTLLGTLNQDVTNYNYKVSDSKECFKTGNFSISNPPELVIEEIDHHQVYCNNEGNGWIKVEVTGGNGGYTFKKSYSDGSITSDFVKISNTEYSINNYSGGSFQPAVIDVNGCSDTLGVVEIIDPPRLVIADVIAGEKQCNDSKDDSTVIELDPVNFGTPGNYQYSIDGGVTFSSSNTFINVRNKTIKPYVVDTMGCVSVFAEKEIIWPDAFIVSIVKNEIKCFEHPYGTLALDIKGGTSPYYASINDIMFTNPDVILKDLLNPTTIDTIGDNILLWGAEHDIFMKDDNDCPVSNFATSDIREPVATYTWDRPEELVFYGITPQRPKCAGNQGYIIYDVEGGTIPYKYWVQSELSSGSVIPTNQDDDGLVDVPTGLKLYAFVTDKYGCRANIPDSILVTNNNYFETYIKAINDTVKVELTTLKQPYCPLTKDGTVGMQIDGYLFAGVTFTIWRLDTVYNNFYEVFSDVITREEATDSFEVIIDDPTVLPGEFVPEMGYSVAKDTIDYKFRIGDYKITFMDNHTECNVTYFFSLDADTMECTDIYPLIFTPNSDGQNDDWIVSKYEKSDVDLKIFNSEGELVYQFQGQVPEEGLRWNGLDLRNRPVPVGTYMYVYQPDVTRNRDGMEYGTVTLLRNN